MKTKILSILIVFICACTQTANQDSTVITKKVNGTEITVCLFENVKTEKTIPLSSLVENCTLIRLDDRDEALVKPWFTTVTDNYIGVRQQGSLPYMLFDHSGKFLCKVGRVGGGPGEYSGMLYDDFIDEKAGLIYLVPMVGKNILVYDLSGKFIKYITPPHVLHKPKLYSSNGLLSVVHMAFPGEKAFAMQFDSDGNLIKSIEPPAHLIANDYNGEIFNTRSNAFDFLHTNNSDTLYHYDIQNNKLQPVFSMEIKATEKPFRQYIELPNGCITTVWGEGNIYTDLKTKTSSFIKVQNDFFGNIDVPITVVTLRNGWFVFNLEPGLLLERIEQRLAESDCSEEDKKALNKLQSSLDANSNNVMFLGKLK